MSQSQSSPRGTGSSAAAASPSATPGSSGRRSTPPSPAAPAAAAAAAVAQPAARRPNMAVRSGPPAGGKRPQGRLSAYKQPATASGKSGGKSGKMPKAAGGVAGGKDTKPTRRRHKQYNSFGTHIFRVLKQIHPETGCSKKAMAVLNSMVFDMFQRLASEAKILCEE